MSVPWKMAKLFTIVELLENQSFSELVQLSATLFIVEARNLEPTRP